MQRVCEIISPCEHYDYILKCIIVGETSVGKTSILHRMTNQDFPSNPVPTIGIEFGTVFTKLSIDTDENTKNSEVKAKTEDSSIIKLQIWDCAGQVRFRNIVRSYFRQAQIVFFVYDVNDYDTFKHLASWIDAVDEQIGTDNYVGCIIGNKRDLPSMQDELLIKHLCETYPYLEHYSVSAKEDEIGKIYEIIFDCIKNAYDKHKNGKIKMEKPYWKSDKYIKLHDKDAENTNCFGGTGCIVL